MEIHRHGGDGERHYLIGHGLKGKQMVGTGVGAVPLHRAQRLSIKILRKGDDKSFARKPHVPQIHVFKIFVWLYVASARYALRLVLPLFVRRLPLGRFQLLLGLPAVERRIHYLFIG